MECTPEADSMAVEACIDSFAAISLRKQVPPRVFASLRDDIEVRMPFQSPK